MPSINPNDQARFQQLLASDPEIQAVTQGVWGNTPVNQRPGDTPKNLEAANHAASQRIGQILASRGVNLPARTFINPRTMSLEGAHGWAGLPPAAKAAIIAGVAATGIGAAGAMGAFGGGAAAAGGAGGAGAGAAGGATAGLSAGAFPAIAGTSGALAGGGATVAGGIGAAAKGASLASQLFGGGGGGTGTIANIMRGAKIAGPILSGLSAGSQKGREAENAAASTAADFRLRESQGNENNLVGRANLDLNRRQDARLGQSDSYKKALQGALAMNMQDVGISGVPKGIPVINFTGGARPSAIGPEGRAAAAELNKQAMAKLMSGEHFDPLPALERTLPPEYRKPSAFENVTGAFGLGANAINSSKAENEQQSFQERILAAIQANAGGGTPKPAPPVDPRMSGVTPFTRPPTVAPPLMGRPLNPYEQGSMG